MSNRIATATIPSLRSNTDEPILEFPGAAHKPKRIVAIAALAAAVLGSNLAAARAHNDKAYARAMHAHWQRTFAGPDCIPANGAQIRGGFAGSDDMISVSTGEICGKP